MTCQVVKVTLPPDHRLQTDQTCLPSQSNHNQQIVSVILIGSDHCFVLPSSIAWERSIGGQLQVSVANRQMIGSWVWCSQ